VAACARDATLALTDLDDERDAQSDAQARA